jgi:uncharacterized iron-regulated protein
MGPAVRSCQLFRWNLHGSVTRAWSAGSGLSRGLVCAALVLGGCAGAAPVADSPAPTPLVFGPQSDVVGSARLVSARARDAEVIYLGELHDNPDHHVIQTRIVEALLADGRRPALAFEMIPETRQAVLDAAIRGNGDPADVDRQLAWTAGGWPDFAMYWPLFELARRHGLPVVATDLDPTINRRISRDGLGAAGADPGRLRSALPDSPTRDQAIVRRIQEAHCNRVSESRALRMLESWYARNVVIARRVGDALTGAHQVVVIMGRGHESPGAVPEQLAALRPGTRQLVVALFAGQADGPVEPLADVVWVTPDRPHPDFCEQLPQRIGALGH